jgi:hypothetical protein
MRTKRPNKAVHLDDGTTVLTLVRRSGETFLCWVDTKDYKSVVKHYRWHYMMSPTHHTGYAATTQRGKTIYMHSMLIPDAKEVDHQDHNGLNNTRSNIRAASKSLNCANRRIFKSKSSQYRGVRWVEKYKNFRADIHVGKKHYSLGSFVSEVDAARVYDAAALEQFGEFAKINFPKVAA